MTGIGTVIGWKFNHQPGMATSDGKITDFPGGIPSQAEQDTWTLEYEARDQKAERVDSVFKASNLDLDKDAMLKLIFEGFFEVSNRLITLEGGKPITRKQLKIWFKGKL